MKTLISMTDFIININEICPKENMEVIEWWGKKLDVIENYAKFLKQPLKLEMFVPCDEDGNVLEYPINISISDNFRFERASHNYLEAKQNVLFEGFFVKKNDDGILCLFHKDYEWEFAEIEPDFVWGRTNEFTIEDIVNYNPRLSFFVLNENAVSRLLSFPDIG